MKLLKDETRFVGASQNEDLVVITTDSRAIVEGTKAMAWILPATSQRFALPVKSLSTTTSAREGEMDKVFLIGCKGDRRTLYEFGEEERVIASALPSPIFAFFPLVRGKTLVVLENGQCQICGLGNNAAPLLLQGVDELIAAEMISPNTLVLCGKRGQVHIVRVDNAFTKLSAARQIRLPLAREIAHCSAHGDVDSERGEFALAVVDEEGKLFTYEVMADDDGSIETWLEHVALPGAVLAVAPAPGLRLLLANERNVQAWDICHGVLLETWPGVDACEFIATSKQQQGGKIVCFGGAMQVQTVEIDAASTSSLARTLAAGARQERGSGASKRLKLSTAQALEDKLSKPAQQQETEEAVSLAFEKGWLDSLTKLVVQGRVASTRCLGERALATALEREPAAGLDFCLAVMEHCADVPALQLVELLHHVLTLASCQEGEEEKFAAGRRALQKYGQGNVDVGAAKLISRAFLAPSLVEFELMHALAARFSCVEEMLALVSCLQFGAETMPESRQAMQILLACAHPLNLVLGMNRLPIFALRALDELRQRLVKEIALCEKSARCIQRLDLILNRNGGGILRTAVQKQQHASSNKYQVETLLL